MVKTLTIMDDAYEMLKQRKGKDESFSDTIRRICQQRAQPNLSQFAGILPMTNERAAEFHRSAKETRRQINKAFEKRRKELEKQWRA